MEEIVINKQGMNFKFKNINVDQYINAKFEYKIENFYENEYSKDGYFYGATFDKKRKRLLFNFKLNDNIINGINLDDETAEMISNEIERIVKIRNIKINDIADKLAKGEMEIQFIQIGNNIEYTPYIKDLSKDMSMYEYEILKRAIKKLVGKDEIIIDAKNYIISKIGNPIIDDISGLTIADNPFGISLAESINAEKIIKSKNRKAEKIKSIFEKAKNTNTKQIIEKWSEPCNDKNEECDIDIVIKYAMPDGTIKIERYHTW